MRTVVKMSKNKLFLSFEHKSKKKKKKKTINFMMAQFLENYNFHTLQRTCSLVKIKHPPRSKCAGRVSITRQMCRHVSCVSRR